MGEDIFHYLGNVYHICMKYSIMSHLVQYAGKFYSLALARYHPCNDLASDTTRSIKEFT